MSTATSDRELLDDCLAAFTAIPTAPSARRLMKKWGLSPAAYAGDGRTILAEYMVRKIGEHIIERDTEKSKS